MSAPSNYAKNPPLSRDTNLPISNGQTQTHNGGFQYLNPMTGTWESAVRLHNIRIRVIQDSFRQGNGLGYTFPQKNGNTHGRQPDNYTSFLLRDQAYGPARTNRNPILFQLRRPNNFGQKPGGYVMDNGCIVLDSFDHGVRDFGDALPLCLSSEFDGWDIETYLRRNGEISFYDLIARTPNGYYIGKQGQAWHAGPPRVGTLSMRATRWRPLAACLSWTEKGDTDAKIQYILSLMPQACQTANSTRDFRDLTKAEQKACETAKGQRSNKARKAKRAAKAREEENRMEEEEGDEGYVSTEGGPTHPQKHQKTNTLEAEAQVKTDFDTIDEVGIQIMPRRRANGASQQEGGVGIWRPRTVTDNGSPLPRSMVQEPKQDRKRAMEEDSVSENLISQQSRKRQRCNDNEIEDLGGEEYASRSKSKRPIARAISRQQEMQLQASSADARSATAFESSINIAFMERNASSAQSSKPRTSYEKRTNYSDNHEEDGLGPTSNPRVALNVKPGTSLLKRAKRDEGVIYKLSTSPAEKVSRTRNLPRGALKSLPNTSLGSTMASTTPQASDDPVSDSFNDQEDDGFDDSTGTDIQLGYEQAHEDSDSVIIPTPRGESNHLDMNADTQGNETFQADINRVNEDVDPLSGGFLPEVFNQAIDDFEPLTDEAFQAETISGIERGDYRYFSPVGPGTQAGDCAILRRAIQLTCIDWCQQTGSPPPSELTDNHRHESYMSQFVRLEKAWDRIWQGAEDSPDLYWLSEWHFGFEHWGEGMADKRGMELWTALMEGEGEL